MIVDEQTAVRKFLEQPLGAGRADAVETMETHISLIFLAGNHVRKLKRAVKLPYVDFSTPELRLAACDKEVELNSRTAPGLYRGVRRISRGPDGGLAFDGDGELVDAVVEMERFEQHDLLDRMAQDGRLTPELMGDVARRIAEFHGEAPVDRSGGGKANMAGVLDINERGFATSHVFADDEVAAFCEAFRDALERHGDLLDARGRAGKVRRCHGDLHLRNICMFRGEPVLFDCIEFNDAIATVDVLYDLAFLLMDLWHRDLDGFANLVANRYLDASGEEDGMPLLPFFMAVRAAVRAHVTATQIEEHAGDRDELERSARSYFDLALRLLRPSPPRLVAIGGYSGTGKTTIAEACAAGIGAPPGARIVESDRIRKALYGVPQEARLGAEAYRPEARQEVYGRQAEEARALLAAGCPVLVDSVFDRPGNRDRIEQAARDLGVAFTGIWLDADPAVLEARVAARHGGPSDATVEVLRKQLAGDPGEIRWHVLDVDAPVGDIAKAVAALVKPPR